MEFGDRGDGRVFVEYAPGVIEEEMKQINELE